MKKIINGKKYDTNTAEKVFGWHYGRPGDHDYVHEELYRKKNGDFFLFGEGGANSEYGVWVDNSHLTDSCNIVPLSVEEAKKWAEKHISAEKYEEIFGEVEE